jgi:hypothetical protein
MPKKKTKKESEEDEDNMILHPSKFWVAVLLVFLAACVTYFVLRSGY